MLTICPDYCAHGRCEHGYKTCQHCSECYAARKLAEEQAEQDWQQLRHEMRVKGAIR